MSLRDRLCRLERAARVDEAPAEDARAARDAELHARALADPIAADLLAKIAPFVANCSDDAEQRQYADDVPIQVRIDHAIVNRVLAHPESARLAGDLARRLAQLEDAMREQRRQPS